MDYLSFKERWLLHKLSRHPHLPMSEKYDRLMSLGYVSRDYVADPNRHNISVPAKTIHVTDKYNLFLLEHCHKLIYDIFLPAVVAFITSVATVFVCKLIGL